jgi:hypothetical protein
MVAAGGVALIPASDASAASACDARDPFTPAFEAAWNQTWGGDDVGAVVEDHLTGFTYAFGNTGAQFPEASTVKVQILAGVLLGAQGGRWSLDSLWGLVQPMIQESDEAAAESLWATLGGYAGMADVAAAFGLSHTYDAATTGGNLSTPGDIVQLLDETVGTAPSPLTAASRDVARSLMTGVDPAQAWGVSAGVPGRLDRGLEERLVADRPHRHRTRRPLTHQLGRDGVGRQRAGAVVHRGAGQRVAELRRRHRRRRGHIGAGGVGAER